MDASVAIIGGIILLITKETIEFVKKKKLKNRLKTGLIDAFSAKDLIKVRKYICHLKDFDTKYKTEKLEKYLIKVCRNNDEVNEEILMTLRKDFSLIEDVYNNKTFYDIRLNELLGKKLDNVERLRKEAIIRENKLNRRAAIKKSKQLKHMRKSGLG